MLNSLYGRNEILSIAVADLALPKIGLDSLVLMASSSVTFRADFLNRVRMNTLQGFQIYSPIGFMEYPCSFMHFCRDCEACDVSQSTGYFDKWNYDVISFYSRDYVQARKRVEGVLPITRNDNDIGQLFTRFDKSINSILDMFVASQLQLHIFRGVEPNLRYGSSIKHFLEQTRNIPECIAFSNNLNTNHGINESFISTRHESRKCLHLASRKQIGDAIIRFEDKSILNK